MKIDGIKLLLGVSEKILGTKKLQFLRIQRASRQTLCQFHVPAIDLFFDGELELVDLRPHRKCKCFYIVRGKYLFFMTTFMKQKLRLAI